MSDEHSWPMVERRKELCLNEHQLEKLKDMIEDAVEEAIDRKLKSNTGEIAASVKEALANEFFSEIGKGVVKKALWIIGLGCFAVFIYLQSKGFIKP